ncbi:MAG: glutamate racemase [Bacteroidia bacterium]|nr:glutamate racemase [Bacteroidia bacterium]
MIGVFDSGLGGLSVWQEIIRILPDVPVIYAADSGRCPYGSKPKEEIIRYSREMTQLLVDQGCRLIVVACNTATAAAIRALREEFDLPFVGMEPAIKPAAEASKTGVVGILATEGTFRGQHFARAREQFASNTHLIMQVGHGLVEWVESGQLDGPEVEAGLRRYLEPMLAQGADQIVLGCTHYPFLRPVMERIVAGKAIIIDPAPAVAQQALRLWEALPKGDQATSKQPYQWFTSGDPDRMSNFLGQLGFPAAREAGAIRMVKEITHE